MSSRQSRPISTPSLSWAACPALSGWGGGQARVCSSFWPHFLSDLPGDGQPPAFKRKSLAAGTRSFSQRRVWSGSLPTRVPALHWLPTGQLLRGLRGSNLALHLSSAVAFSAEPALPFHTVLMGTQSPVQVLGPEPWPPFSPRHSVSAHPTGSTFKTCPQSNHFSLPHCHPLSGPTSCPPWMTVTATLPHLLHPVMLTKAVRAALLKSKQSSISST